MGRPSFYRRSPRDQTTISRLSFGPPATMEISAEVAKSPSLTFILQEHHLVSKWPSCHHLRSYLLTWAQRVEGLTRSGARRVGAEDGLRRR
jgi:hypothetical protein